MPTNGLLSTNGDLPIYVHHNAPFWECTDLVVTVVWPANYFGTEFRSSDDVEETICIKILITRNEWRQVFTFIVKREHVQKYLSCSLIFS